MNETKLVDKYLKKEVTTTGDIALPEVPTKKKKEAQMKITKKGGKKKKQLLFGNDDES